MSFTTTANLSVLTTPRNFCIYILTRLSSCCVSTHRPLRLGHCPLVLSYSRITSCNSVTLRLWPPTTLLTRYILGTVVKLRLSSARTKSVRSSSGCIKRVLSRHILMTEKFLRSGTVMTTTRAMLSGSTRALHISRRSKTTSTTRCS